MLLSYTLEYCRSILSSCLFAQPPWFACKGTRVVGRPPSPSSTGAQLTGLSLLIAAAALVFKAGTISRISLVPTFGNKMKQTNWVEWSNVLSILNWYCQILLASYLAYPTYPFLQDSHTAALNRSKCWQSGQAARKIRFWDKSIPQIGSAMRALTSRCERINMAKVVYGSPLHGQGGREKSDTPKRTI